MEKKNVTRYKICILHKARHVVLCQMKNKMFVRLQNHVPCMLDDQQCLYAKLFLTVYRVFQQNRFQISSYYFNTGS